MMKKPYRTLIVLMTLLLSAILLVSGCNNSSGGSSNNSSGSAAPASQPDAEDAALQFDPADATKTDVETLNVTLDGTALEVTKYTVT